MNKIKKIHLDSIKFKITCWYTGIMILIFLFVMGGIFLSSEKYGEKNMKNELLDEVRDLEQDILRYPEYFPEGNSMTFYDDGVMLSIYDEAGNYINGVLPDEFSSNKFPFMEDHIQAVGNDEENWFLCDKKLILEGGTIYWVRGIYSYSSLIVMIRQMTFLMCLLFPVLIITTALVGYRMIQHSLSPIPVITGTVQEITESASLDTRLDMPQNKDEFYELCSVFNQMLESLEKTFLREKQFSSDAAHELRTPISIIQSHCEYCLEEMNPDEKLRDELSIIYKKSEQMSKLVSQLLMISRTEQQAYKPNFEQVDLLMVAESVAEELGEAAETKGITISIYNQIKNPVIEADLTMMMRVFMNLVGNAIQYGRENGYVKIYLEKEEETFQISVRDNGIGISKEDQEKIWDRFYRADQSRSQTEGFGLGLFMVKRIVENHGGVIVVESIPNEGSTFMIQLPEYRIAKGGENA